MKLAVRAPNWVGDLVMATPVLEAALGAASEVSILIRAHLAELLRDGPLESHLVPIRSSREELAFYRAGGHDAVCLLSNSLGSAWRAFRARVPLRAGSALRGRRIFLTHAVVPPTRGSRRVPIPTAHLMRDIAGLVGIRVPDLHPVLAVSAEQRISQALGLRGLGFTAEESGYVVCCPGAAFGAAKLWPPEFFARALDHLHERHGWRAVITGSPSESPLIEEVGRRTRHDAVCLPEDVRSLAGLKALIADARFLLVGDSGPRWIAAAFDIPCVSVMGPNFPELTATSLEVCEVVRVEGLECAPCLEKRCPLEHHRCMRELTPESVIEAAERVLERSTKLRPQSIG